MSTEGGLPARKSGRGQDARAPRRKKGREYESPRAIEKTAWISYDRPVTYT